MDGATAGFEAFVAIVDEGSVTAAARRLGIPRATLSRTLSALEASLGVRLLHRTTRRMALTPAGETLYRTARRVVDEAAAVREEVARLDDVPRGLLRLTVPGGTDGARLGSLLTAFLDRWPAVSLEVLATGRHVDLAAEGYDAGLRGGVVRDPSLIARSVWRTRTLCVASPSYLAQRGVPAVPADLVDHNALVGMAGGEVAERSWPVREGGAVRVSGRLATNDLVMRWLAAREGRGIALLPEALVRDDLDTGALVAVLQDSVGHDSTFSVVYVERALQRPVVRAFVQHVVDWFADAGALPLLPGGVFSPSTRE